MCERCKRTCVGLAKDAPSVGRGRSRCAAGVREGARALPEGSVRASKEDTGASRRRIGAQRPPSAPTAV
eukprot:12620769-Alexandrium_andersonii.AAC.1